MAFKGRGCGRESVSAACRRCQRWRRQRHSGGGRCERAAAVALSSHTFYCAQIISSRIYWPQSVASQINTGSVSSVQEVGPVLEDNQAVFL